MLFLVLTMYKKSVKLYNSNSVLSEFFLAAASDNPNKLKKLHIPKSDVFYVQKALEARTGHVYSLDNVERAMYLEGHLSADEVLDPKRKRGYCSYDA